MTRGACGGGASHQRDRAGSTPAPATNDVRLAFPRLYENPIVAATLAGAERVAIDELRRSANVEAKPCDESE